MFTLDAGTIATPQTRKHSMQTIGFIGAPAWMGHGMANNPGDNGHAPVPVELQLKVRLQVQERPTGARIAAR